MNEGELRRETGIRIEALGTAIRGCLKRKATSCSHLLHHICYVADVILLQLALHLVLVLVDGANVCECVNTCMVVSGLVFSQKVLCDTYEDDSPIIIPQSEECKSALRFT